MPRTLSATAHRSVIDATVELLAEHSIRDVTVDAVSSRSGVAKTTIYRHFESRDELLAAAIRATMAAIPDPEPTGRLDTDLSGWVERFVDAGPRPRAPRAAIEFLAEMVSSPVLVEVHDEMVDGFLGSLTRILDDARARGEIRADAAAEFCADVIAGPLVVRRLRGATLDEGDAAALINLVLEGLRSNATPTR